jgi:hypothetical protein
MSGLNFQCYGCTGRGSSRAPEFRSERPRNGCWKVKSQDIWNLHPPSMRLALSMGSFFWKENSRRLFIKSTAEMDADLLEWLLCCSESRQLQWLLQLLHARHQTILWVHHPSHKRKESSGASLPDVSYRFPPYLATPDVSQGL